MSQEQKDALDERLYALLASTSSPDDIRRILEDLCTHKEVEQMAQRLECARLLLAGETYMQIIQSTDISSATLSRISRCLQYGSGGYANILPAFLEAEQGQ